MLGGIAVGRATTSGLANAVLANDEAGRPLEWLDSATTRLGAITAPMMNEAIRRRVDLERLVVSRAGDLSATSEPRARL